ncbi:hypothetical protein HD73_3519 [Bacillus thuringiensis serovar kurstaki str. HD73]|nr:hypothetical protein HD73_3519 [Bacillus thuringiensis serovar kurstaki str. HD73]QDD83680.1 hypothetical protein FORC087_2381 [Bacillus cereus]
MRINAFISKQFFSFVYDMSHTYSIQIITLTFLHRLLAWN